CRATEDSVTVINLGIKCWRLFLYPISFIFGGFSWVYVIEIKNDVAGVINSSLISGRADAMDASTAEKRPTAILNGLGFNKQKQANKTRYFYGRWTMRTYCAGVMRSITYEYAILLLNGNVAEIIRLSLVHPFVGVKGRHMFELRRGVNYAVPGATALDFAFHAARGVNNPMTNLSLRVQLGWFKYSLPFLCANVP
ncbi:hypothetical protein Tco_1396628, partial [Tanacetum coccineum]